MVENTKICPFCKSQIPASASKCAHCGSEVSRLGLTSNVLKNVGLLILMVGLLGFCLMFVIGLIR